VDTHILKTILEEAGLNVFLKDEIMGTMVKGAQAVEVVIPTDELAQAMPIVQQFIHDAAKPIKDES
ncbi:MAG: putative signal transducing protein, partial [Lentisphaeria bacterium]